MATEKHNLCPFCRERIKPDAIKCKHCGSVLKNETPPFFFNSAESTTFIRNALKEFYEIIETKGKGGMATVYKARQKSLDRIVALKVIHPNLIHDEEFVSRFFLEARIGASLSHPNIVNIYDFGEVGGVFYMSMEFLDGNDLASIIHHQGRIEPEKALQYIQIIAESLNYIHQKGLLHRDVKSANIIIDENSRPVLTDFGIAYAKGSKSLTIPGTLLGTPEYLSPEQVESKSISSESDFYSLGIVLYECLTGKVPFQDSNPIIIINKIVNNFPESPRALFPDIPENIEELCLGLLNKDRRKRSGFISYLIEKDDLINLGKNFKRKKKTKTTPSEKVLKKSGYIQHSRQVSQERKKIFLLGVLVMLFFTILLGLLNISTDSELKTFYREPARRNNEHELPNINSTPIEVPRSINNSNEESNHSRSHNITRPNLISLIEEKMISINGTHIMRDYISNRIWNLVMKNETGGNNEPVRSVSFISIEEFIDRINGMEGNPYQYTLPNVNILIDLRNDGILELPRREWCNDPPVFPTGTFPDMAKFYHPQFNAEAGEKRDRVRNDIFFRLTRTR